MVEAVYSSSARVRGKNMLERFCSVNQMRATYSALRSHRKDGPTSPENGLEEFGRHEQCIAFDLYSVYD
ncbi:hypothetical protein KCU95_g86, partial [Aureobasidium melanogenum]